MGGSTLSLLIQIAIFFFSFDNFDHFFNLKKLRIFCSSRKFNYFCYFFGQIHQILNITKLGRKKTLTARLQQVNSWDIADSVGGKVKPDQYQPWKVVPHGSKDTKTTNPTTTVVLLSELFSAEEPSAPLSSLPSPSVRVFIGFKKKNSKFYGDICELVMSKSKFYWLVPFILNDQKVVRE